MLKGKNILWGSALYLGSIYLLYGSKQTTYKDQDEVKSANPLIRIRETGSGEDHVRRTRAQQWKAYADTKQYKKAFSKDATKAEEAKSEFMKLEYVR